MVLKWRSFTFHLVSPVKESRPGACSWGTNRSCRTVRSHPFLCHRQIPPPLPGHPVPPSPATHILQQSAQTLWKWKAKRWIEKQGFLMMCPVIYQQANLQHLGCLRPTGGLSVRLRTRSLVRDSTVSDHRRTHTNRGSWSQHQQIPLKPSFMLSPGRLHSKNS